MTSIEVLSLSPRRAKGTEVICQNVRFRKSGKNFDNEGLGR